MSNVEKISIALPSEMLETIRDAVESGGYATTSEVIREALRHWQANRIVDQVIARHGLEELRASLKEADESIDRGEGIPAEELYAELTARYTERAKRKKRA
ncbi:MAG TPA: ribbon-helix-helix protein, CopG family [Rhizomicrobium sp.]|jgi:antitoxin ParD1/3/4